jgi:predicted nucleotidyltransferase
MDGLSKQRLREVAAEVFSPHAILAAYAYGSRISGKPRPESDLDVGYYTFQADSGRCLSIRDEMAMSLALSERLGFDVDFRCLDGAPLELRGRVLEEGIRIYSGDDVQRVSLERATLALYHDYKDVFRNMREVRLRGKARRGIA